MVKSKFYVEDQAFLPGYVPECTKHYTGKLQIGAKVLSIFQFIKWCRTFSPSLAKHDMPCLCKQCRSRSNSSEEDN